MRTHIHTHTSKSHTGSLSSNSVKIVHAHTKTHVTLIFLIFLPLTSIESTEAHSLSTVSRGSGLQPEWTEFQSGMLDWWRQLSARWWMVVWMGGMKEDSAEKSAAARSTGDIIIQKVGRLLRAGCVCLCVFTLIPYCVEMREGKGQESQTLTERESLHDCWLYVYELVIDLLPPAEVLEQ